MEDCQVRWVPKVLKVSQEWEVLVGLSDHLVFLGPKETVAPRVSPAT